MLSFSLLIVTSLGGNEEMVRNMEALHARSIPDPFLHSLLVRDGPEGFMRRNVTQRAASTHTASLRFVPTWLFGLNGVGSIALESPQALNPNPAGHFKSRGPQCFLFARLMSF